MKIIYNILLLILTLRTAWGSEPVSIDEFKKIKSESERRKIIDHAPPDQKEALKKIDIHMGLVGRWGGEAGLKAAKEREVTAARGFGQASLETIFDQQTMIWENYIGEIAEANKKTGMALKERADVEKKLMDEEEPFVKRIPIAHSLVFHLAASPRALELEKDAEKLSDEMYKRISTDGITPLRPITKEERMAFDKRVQQIYDELEKLPKITPEQAQKEYDAFPEEKIRGGSGD